jgi:hypothetical protein
MFSVRPIVTRVLGTAGLLALAVSSFGCGEDAADTGSDGVSALPPQAVVRQHTFGWIRVGDCATAIGVSPDDTLWLVGCDTRADGDIWYTRLEGDGFADSRVWALTHGRGKKLFVDDAGQAYTTTSSNDRFWSTVTRTNGNPPTTPTLDWAPWIVSLNGTIQDQMFNHLESYMVFHTASDGSPNLGEHQFYRITKPSDGSLDGRVWYKTLASSSWTDTGIKAQSLALFTPPRGQNAAKELWTLDSKGGMRTYDPTVNNGGFVRPTPASGAYWLTDHYAITSSGVYHWSDANGAWEFYLDRTTPTGQIIQVAHAGATTVKLPSGTSATYESGVWAVDNAGVIYKAGDDTSVF